MGYESYRGGRERGGYERGRYGARDDVRNERGYERGGYDRDRGQQRYGRDPRDYDYDDRGFFDRAGDEVRSWFGDDDAERRRRADERHYREEYERDARRYGRPSSAASYPWYGGLGFEGYGVGVPPLVPPYGGYGDVDAGYRADRGDSSLRRDYDRGVQGRGGRDEGHDPNYRSWRDRQMESFDRDYDEYRREHQSQFDTHFGSWREQRQGQRQSLGRAQPHQEVVGSDGKHVGTVDHVRGDRILLTKTDKDAGGHHHSIPVAWIESVDDKVKINKTADDAQRLWKDEEQNSAFWNDRDQGSQGGQEGGGRNLDRAFRGTY